MTNKNKLIPIILSGGAGSRLWPISRESHPKPFIKLQDGQSLLQKTYQRASNLANVSGMITVTNKEYYLKSKAEYEKLKTDEAINASFLLEPIARNTAPAIALAALKAAAEYGREAILLVLPADHLIADTAIFSQQCERAYQLALAGNIVTFGIQPTLPETGFGYIQCGMPHPNIAHTYQVASFVEKPSAQLAETYLASKQYLWNSGMFCFRADVILQQLEQHAPDLFYLAKDCWTKTEALQTNAQVVELDVHSFQHLKDISIDYAVMEKSEKLMVIACNMDWHDIGSWDAYKKLFRADHNGNTILGDAIVIDSKNNLIHSDNRMVASIGVDDLAIIDTPDALLITRRDRAQDVKQVVQTLKNNAHESYLTHRTVMRPWGSYTVLEEGPGFKIKRIMVRPGASLSLQVHKHRSEHWVVVSGTANVINGETEYRLKTNESTFVPLGTAHRLSNPEITDLIIIEVQTGQYLGEDDIIRLDDTYGRVK
jgi:mannose-1-phosphate guanylyltransferase / mannose-6-phosphate isomerase